MLGALLGADLPVTLSFVLTLAVVLLTYAKDLHGLGDASDPSL